MIMKTAKAKGNKAVRLFNGSRDPGMAKVGEGGGSGFTSFRLHIVHSWSFFFCFVFSNPPILSYFTRPVDFFFFFSIPLASGLDF